MKRYKDIIAGSVLLALSAFYFSQTFLIKKIAFIDPLVGSARFPQIIAIILMICAAIIIFQGIASLKAQKETIEAHKTLMEIADEAENGEETTSKAQIRKGNFKVFLVLGSFAVFCFLMDKIGFGAASFLYLWSQMVIMSHDKQNWKSLLVYGGLSLVLAIGIFAMFRYGFGLILPKALWF